MVCAFSIAKEDTSDCVPVEGSEYNCNLEIGNCLGSEFAIIRIASLDLMASQGFHIESLLDDQSATKRPITVDTF